MSYLPSIRSLNPFYWYGSSKSNTTQLVEGDISERSDKCTDLNLCPSTANYLPGSLASKKNSNSSSSSSISNSTNWNGILPSGPALKVPTNNGTSSMLQVSTTRSPLVSTTTAPKSTITMTTTTTTTTTTAAAVAGDFTRGSIRNLFTTKKPNILIDKPTQWPKKFKILKNGKVYDVPGHVSVVDQNLGLPSSDNNNKNSTNYQNTVVAYDSNDDKRENRDV